MFDPYYEKLLNADGIPVISSAAVSDAALVETARILNGMIGGRTDIRAALIANEATAGVIGINENTTDIPEHAFLKLDQETDWDVRARGFGGTIWIPITTSGEENLLCLESDKWSGENVFIHEFAHTLMNLALPFIPGGIDILLRITVAYDSAIAAGLWQNTYAGSNFEEYWAEGVQTFFNAERFVTPSNGIDNEIATRSSLVVYDPTLAALIAEVVNEEWSYDLACSAPTP